MRGEYCDDSSFLRADAKEDSVRRGVQVVSAITATQTLAV